MAFVATAGGNLIDGVSVEHRNQMECLMRANLAREVDWDYICAHLPVLTPVQRSHAAQVCQMDFDDEDAITTSAGCANGSNSTGHKRTRGRRGGRRSRRSGSRAR